MLTEEQRAARMKGIGGSDVAAILGLSPWKTSFQLYMEKRGEFVEEDKNSELIHFGNVLEDVVANEYARRNDVKVQRRNDIIVHDEHKFMQAFIDRKVVGSKKGLECKTADKYTRGKWGEAGSDEVPESYRLQSEHYMIVTGYPEWDLAVLIGGNEYRDYTLKQDAELSEMIIEECAEFWKRVEQGIPPELEFDHPTTIDMLKRLHAGLDDGQMEFPKELLHWHQVKLQADEEVKRYSAVSDACKARILAAMKEHSVGVFPDICYQYKRTKINRKESVVKASSYVKLTGSKWTPPKEKASE